MASLAAVLGDLTVVALRVLIVLNGLTPRSVADPAPLRRPVKGRAIEPIANAQRGGQAAHP
jgi:hypothetical protein